MEVLERGELVANPERWETEANVDQRGMEVCRASQVSRGRAGAWRECRGTKGPWGSPVPKAEVETLAMWV